MTNQARVDTSGQSSAARQRSSTHLADDASAVALAVLDLQPFPSPSGSDYDDGSLTRDSLGSFRVPPPRTIRRPLTTDDAPSLHWCKLPPPQPVPRPPLDTSLVCKFEPDNVRDELLTSLQLTGTSVFDISLPCRCPRFAGGPG
jgi:hypothetical protein